MEAHALHIPKSRLQMLQALRLAKVHACEFADLDFEPNARSAITSALGAAMLALRHRRPDAAMLIRKVAGLAHFEQAWLFSTVCESIGLGLGPLS